MCRQFAATAPAFNLPGRPIPHLHLAPPLGQVTPFEFCRDFRCQKTIESWDIVWNCLRDPLIPRLAIRVEHRVVT